MDQLAFIVTQELGKLAKWLRILGFDCVYFNKKKEADLIIQALRDRRIIVARKRELSKHKGIQVVVIKHDHVEDQMEQLVKELNLELKESNFFSRCVECNTLLEDIEKEKVKEKVPDYVFKTQNSFKRCPDCEKIFWQGTHWDMVGKWLEEKGLKK